MTRHYVFQRFLCAFPVADFRLEKDLSKKSSRFALSDNILTARLKKRINGKKSKVKLAVNQRQKLRRCLLRAARLSGRDVRTVCRLLCREFFLQARQYREYGRGYKLYPRRHQQHELSERDDALVPRHFANARQQMMSASGSQQFVLQPLLSLPQQSSIRSRRLFI